MAKREAKKIDLDVTTVPVLPLRDVVVYPHMVIPLFVGRKSSIKALEHAMEMDKEIFLVAQKEASIENPAIKDLYDVGTIATILQLLKLPDGTVKVLVEGNFRGKVECYDKDEDDNYLSAEIKEIESDELSDREAEVLSRSLLAQFEQFVKLNKKVPQEILLSLNGIEDPERLVDSLSAHVPLKLSDKQKLIEIVDTRDRIEHLMALIESEIDLMNVEKKIRRRVKTQMEKSQREYYLNEQIKAIQHELGEDELNELQELEDKIKKAGMGKEAFDRTMVELKKLKQMPQMSAEATVCRNYIDWMLDIPWKKRSKVNDDLANAENILEEDHYGLEKVKERILEYLAVQQRVKKQKGPILCLVGPPGVGKTSLGQSIARATNRKFVRMALGGVRDEAEIRGHRRTYIGSMPGKIIQKLSKAKVKNPLFLLDEIDKMAMDFRGDPAAALLEVLDPEQNDSFNDHYIEVDYDLSDVMFIATSNSMNIPAPLLDRMEVIRIAGYTEDEKLHIAEKYLLPSQMVKNGVKEGELKVPSETIKDIIRYYTREAGVRSLDRAISKLGRKAVKNILLSKGKEQKITINPDNLEDYLGVKQFRYGIAEEKDHVGQVNGLAWTEVGGELLKIESSIVVGSGKTKYTGQLGDVMKESIEAAISVVRARSDSLKLPLKFNDKIDIHIHVPEGATPKDGPSAGISMCTAIVSALTGIPVRADVAMTGEITLRGDVLPIGGLKEKLLAARRAGIKTVIIPDENVKDLKEIPDNIKDELEIKPVKLIDEVLSVALSKKVLVGKAKVRTIFDIVKDYNAAKNTNDKDQFFDRH